MANQIGHVYEHLADITDLVKRHFYIERNFLLVTFAYMIIVSVLSLAIPVAVQTLVNSIAYINLKQPLIVITSLLLFFSLVNVIFKLLKHFTQEMFQRRFIARNNLLTTHGIYNYISYCTEEELNMTLPHFEKINRSFEIFQSAKLFSKIYLSSLEIVLQLVVGLSLLFFYHPYFIFFNLIFIFGLMVILNFYLIPSIKTSLVESKKKYQIVNWLESEFLDHLRFKMDNITQKFSIKKPVENYLEGIDELNNQYLKSRQKHYRLLIGQVGLILTLMVFMSALLLGGGGFLVILGELTLGQLVSAEIVITMIIGNINKAGSVLEEFYNLCASLSKLDFYYDCEKIIEKE
jgi:putative ABC transport system ATP-binding protein